MCIARGVVLRKVSSAGVTRRGGVSGGGVGGARRFVRGRLVKDLFRTLGRGLFMLLRLMSGCSRFGVVPAMAGGLVVVGMLMFFKALMTRHCNVSLTGCLKLRFFLTDSFGPTRLVACVFVRNKFDRVFFGVFTIFVFKPVLRRA